jgi:SAM-dependent methyltransferase
VGTKLLYRGEGFAMGRCPGCGLVRQNPRLARSALLDDHYDGYVQRTGKIVRRPQAYAGLETWQSQPLAAYEAGIQAVERQRRRTGERGVWLDVGASTGSTLVAARTAGWVPAGVEVGRKQVEVCRDVHGIEVHHGTLADAAFPDAFAEVVSYRQVLEHVHDPVEELGEARRVLAPDGLLLVEVPNYGGLRYAFGRLRTALRVSRPYWERLNVPEHLFYFDVRTLGALLEKTGFERVSLATYGRTRPERGPLRRVWDGLHHGLKLGNKLRVVAGPRGAP